MRYTVPTYPCMYVGGSAYATERDFMLSYLPHCKPQLTTNEIMR